MPDYVRRIENAVVDRGEFIGGFGIWPSAHPRITLQTGESLSISLRIRRDQREPGELKPQNSEVQGVAYRLRSKIEGKEYWLDIDIPPSSDPGPRTVPLTIPVANGSVGELGFSLRLKVLSQGLVVTPRSVDLGELSISKFSIGQVLARIGVRKQTGLLRVKSVVCTIPFLKLDLVPVVEGSNYLVLVTVPSIENIGPGSFSGVVQIDTDDPQKPRIEVPFRVTLTR